MKVKKCFNKKNLAIAGISLATITGTFGGNEGGFAPIYNKKVGISGGINIGLCTEFQPGSKFYGLNLSFWNYNSGIINGANLGLLNYSNPRVESKLNGLEVGIVNVVDKKSLGDSLGWKRIRS